ncbi:MFS transporter [Actinopolymorpha singaporensis]
MSPGRVSDRDPVTVFVRWTWCRAFLHRGWWLVASVYLVVDAHLSAAQLVLIGVAQGLVAFGFEVPAGVVADTVSRKWSLVLSHLLMGSAMLATGLVTGFWLVVATQMLWGLAWTFASGADVAWITDELDDPARVSGVLVRAGRAQLTGAAAGMVSVGALASLMNRSTAMVLAGSAMLALGAYVGCRFREGRFVPTRTGRWSASWRIAARGVALVRCSRVLLVVFAGTFLVNGAEDAFGRLYPRRLVELGFPADPVTWFTVLGVLTLLVGAVALRLVEPRIDDVRTAPRGYVVACAVGALGLVGLASSPGYVHGGVAVLFVAGVAVPLTRVIATIWLNRETSGDVRATVHSFLAQAEYAGEVVCGGAVALVAASIGLRPALVGCAVLLVATTVLVPMGTPAGQR